jgi:hypothetical protein
VGGDDARAYLRGEANMIEDVQSGLQHILENNLEDQLAAYENYDSVILDMEDVAEWRLSFDPVTTVFNKYPVGLILGFRSPQRQELCSGVKVVRMHELAVVYMLVQQDLDKLMRKRSRYAQATEEIFHEINTGQLSDAAITGIFDIEAVYDRPLRDERDTAFVGSVWIACTVREDASW